MIAAAGRAHRRGNHTTCYDMASKSGICGLELEEKADQAEQSFPCLCQHLRNFLKAAKDNPLMICYKGVDRYHELYDTLWKGKVKWHVGNMFNTPGGMH